MKYQRNTGDAKDMDLPDGGRVSAGSSDVRLRDRAQRYRRALLRPARAIDGTAGTPVPRATRRRDPLGTVGPCGVRRPDAEVRR